MAPHGSIGRRGNCGECRRPLSRRRPLAEGCQREGGRPLKKKKAYPHPEADMLFLEASEAPEVSHYDYIIVGEGTAGCPLAATLSQNFNVLLLERGGVPYGNNNISRIENFAKTLADVSSISASQRFVSEDGVINARARVLGGGSCLNAGFYTRASPDSDALLDVGILPDNGFTYDHMYGTKVGGTIFDDDGNRHTAADLLEYVNPHKLAVLLYATVHRVLFATEGAMGSPQLLMLSGVGPEEHLRSLEIPVVVDLPAVGQGMADNPMNAIFVPSPNPVEISLIQVVGIAKFGSYIEAASGSNFAGVPIPRDFGMISPEVIDGSTFNFSPGTNPQATVMMLVRYMGISILRERNQSIENTRTPGRVLTCYKAFRVQTFRNMQFRIGLAYNQFMAHGVMYRDSNGKKHYAYLKKGAGNEIIISAGAMGSPQLLMLSGVGPEEHLRSLEIPVVVDLPAVGQGMADNPMNAIFVPSPNPVEISLIQVVGIAKFGSYIEAASGSNFAGATLQRDFGMMSPEIGQLAIVPPKQRTPQAIAQAVEIQKSLPAAAFMGGFLLEKVIGPLSTGYLHLRNRNVDDNPSVTFNYFQEPEDLERS
eukprot:Gb_38455 [translate_table: standard]